MKVISIATLCKLFVCFCDIINYSFITKGKHVSYIAITTYTKVCR